MGRNFLRIFKVCLTFHEKWFCIRWPNFAFFSLVHIFNHSEDLPYFTRKIALCSLTKFCIFESCTNIQSFRRFDLGSWQTLKQVRKLQHGNKVFWKFQALPHFSRSVVLYLSGKFDIFKPWTNIQSLRKLELGF